MSERKGNALCTKCRHIELDPSTNKYKCAWGHHKKFSGKGEPCKHFYDKYEIELEETKTTNF